MSYDELVKVLLDEYDNDARQLAAQSEIERLAFDQSMLEEDSQSLDAGLRYLVDNINVLTPRSSPKFRSDEHKKRFFRKAVLHAKWASTLVGQMTTSRFVFKILVTALREQIQIEEERHSPMQIVTGAYLRQYRVHPKYLQNRPPNNCSQYPGRGNPLVKDGRHIFCHTCGSDSYISRHRNTATGSKKYSNFRSRVVCSLQGCIPDIQVLSEFIIELHEAS